MGRPALTKTKSLHHARRLRRDRTEAEAKLWVQLRDRRLADVKFRRQVPIGPFIADFCAEKYKLVIELDGSQHAGASYDEKRGARLAANGYRVLRFWNNDVFENMDGVLEAIFDAIHAGERR
jgi:very-short-patch-repair endonuclease